jgi:hypothetical protein
MLLNKCRLIWSSGFRGEDFCISTNQKQELPMAAMFVIGSGKSEHSDWLNSKKKNPLKPLSQMN